MAYRDIDRALALTAELRDCAEQLQAFEARSRESAPAKIEEAWNRADREMELLFRMKNIVQDISASPDPGSYGDPLAAYVLCDRAMKRLIARMKALEEAMANDIVDITGGHAEPETRVDITEDEDAKIFHALAEAADKMYMMLSEAATTVVYAPPEYFGIGSHFSG